MIRHIVTLFAPMSLAFVPLIAVSHLIGAMR